MFPVQIWSLAVSPNAKYVVSSGHDKSLRLWERTEEVLVLDDERETEREKEDEDQLATGDSRPIPGERDNAESGMPAKKTVESEKSAERLMEAIQLYRSYTAELAENEEESKAVGKRIPAPPMPPLMVAYQSRSPEDYMARMIELVKSSELEQTLLVLPFDVTIHLLEIVRVLLEENKSVETVCRMFFFLVEINFGPLSVAKNLFPLIKRVRDLADSRLSELRDCVGFNQAALHYHQNKIDERERTVELVEAVTSFKEKRRKKKNKEKAMQTAILSL